MECFLIISYYILFVIDKFTFRTICFQTIFFYIFCYLYNKQLYTCNSYGTCRYDPFQQRLVNLHRIPASKDHSNAMAYDNHCQHHSHMIHGICIGKIPCRRWNRNKNRIKQRHSHSRMRRKSHQGQKGHNEHRAARSGRGTYSSGYRS